MERAAIIGVGWYGFKPTTPEVSFREMMFEAATRAYQDAGIDPRRDVDAFLSAQEDFWEGIAIADEFAPEPIGGVLRPTVTVAGDGMQALANAVMLVQTGYFDIVAVEAHGKPSDIASLGEIYDLALDPIHHRPVKPAHPFFMMAFDAQAYMMRAGAEPAHLALVAASNRNAGLRNPRASYAARIGVDEVLDAEPVIDPLTRYDIAGFSDAAIVMVVARESVAKTLTDKPVYIDGIGYATETGTGTLEWHSWGRMPSMRIAAMIAYRQAGISDPSTATDFAEVEDRASHYQLIALEELGLAPEDQAHKLFEKGEYSPDSSYPVNPSGGTLSLGVSLEATGLARVLEAVLQLRGEAGSHQLSGVERAIVASWRGPPTTTSMVAVLSGPEFG
ncbi:MAG: thiolase domain-containing protein [Desulfurococcales archaeon]|nr:thiolase domain-containing protein [Desulfurococcales archaeon]